MRHAIALVLVAGTVAGTASAQAPRPEPTSPREVIARHLAALGGEARLRAVPQRHCIRKVELRANGIVIEADVETHYLAPDRVRLRTRSADAGDLEMGFDGEVGWMVSEVLGTRVLEGAELAAVRAHAPAVPDWSAARDLAFLGRRTFEGEPMHVLAWTDTTATMTEYFDVRTGLWRASEARDPRTGRTTTFLYGDYTMRDGHMVAMREDIRRDGETVSTAITMVLDHEPIAASVFAPPAALRSARP